MFAKTETGYINVNHVASISQQLGGAYRVRWSDGMVQVIPRTDGEAITAAIKESTKTKRTGPVKHGPEKKITKKTA